MDLRSSNPFWLLNDGMPANYPSLRENIHTDIAVIGAGITGALVAHHLFNAGFKVCVFDKRHVGTGSTAASTALLQYEIDTPLHKLSKFVGEKNAIASYKLCLRSIDDLEKICNKLKTPVDLELKKSLQYASYKKDVHDLKTEFTIRKKNGIGLDYLTGQDIKNKFGFYAPAGIISEKGGQVDAYKLTHELFISDTKKGLNVFDNTEITDIENKKRSVQLTTASGNIISAKKLVIACGYESQKYVLKNVENLRSTYAIVSEPLDTNKIWYQNCIIWETADPYLYLRTTKDKRILIGGKDENSFAKLFPKIIFKTDFQWAGTFSTTKDGLPYIGKIPQRPHTYFALGFGGNGITYSLIAAQAITQNILGKKHEALELFSFDR
jgi:glycine/D-amino acid oxidase-like deaminating enzyme